MRILDANGKVITNNQVNVNSKFTIQVPVTTPAGSITFKGTAKVSTTNPFVFDGKGKYQDAIAMIATSETLNSKDVKATWARQAGTVKVHKVDQDGKPLKGAEFTLTDNNGTKTAVVTGDDGLATFNIQQGLTYSLEETKVPEGYMGSFKQTGISLSSNGQVFEYTAKNTLKKGTITVHKVDQDGNPLADAEFTSFKQTGISLSSNGQVFEYTAKNTLKKGTITVHKVDQDGNPLADAEFTLTDSSSQTQVEKTGKDGIAKFNIVANQTYILEETKVPEGFTGSFKQEGISLKDDGQDFSYEATNTLKKGVVKVHKVDQDGKPLADAEFTLTDNDGKTDVKKSDKDGLVSFDIVANKTYKVEETKNPNGPLADAEFTLTDNDGKTDVKKSDKDGLVSFDIVANKTYKVEETKNPNGYDGTFKQEGITIKDDGQVFEYTADNNLKKGVIKVHKVDQDGKPLAEAEFTLTDNDGKTEVKKSDKDGLVSFDIVANKTYKVEETKNPTGYVGKWSQDGITLQNDGQVFEYTAKNTLAKGVIKVHKVDQDGKPLADAEFTMTDDKGGKEVKKSDKDGLVSFDIVANKIYKVEETQNPNGYTGKWSKDKITLANDGQTFEYTVKNNRVPETVRTGGIGTTAFLAVAIIGAVGLGGLYVYFSKKEKMN